MDEKVCHVGTLYDSNDLLFVQWVARFLAMQKGKDQVVSFWPCIVFCDTKAMAGELADAASKELGFAVPLVTGDLSVKKRQLVADEIRAGKLDVAVSTPCWSQGIDIPNLKTVVLTGQGSAPIKLIQQAGRGARPAKPSFDIVVLERPGKKENAEKKAKRLLEEGYEMGSSPFVQELLDGASQERGSKGEQRKEKREEKSSTSELDSSSLFTETMLILRGGWMPQPLKRIFDIVVILFALLALAYKN